MRDGMYSKFKSLEQHIPEPLKPFLRMTLRYLRLLKRNQINEIRIKQFQEILLKENYPPNINKLIIFLTPGLDTVTGGILSISSIYEETVKLKPMHGAEVIMCTVPGDPSLLKYTKFENVNYIYGFSQLLSYFKNLQELIIHIPEYAIGQFLINLTNKNYSRLRLVKKIHINIMLQNIENIDEKKIKYLKEIGKITCTTAHEQYSTLNIRRKLQIPLHKLSVYVSPEQYNKIAYMEKEELMIVSPDNHPKKSEILSIITEQFPKLRILIIKNLTYKEYKKVISRAKWALTFGEGLDGYFLETIFSGGVSFAVYNSTFFTKDFKYLRTIYDNYETMAKKICSNIRELDNEKVYSEHQNKQYALCAEYYNYGNYVKNLELFYEGRYTYE